MQDQDEQERTPVTVLTGQPGIGEFVVCCHLIYH